MNGITTHVLDTSRGRPADGLPVLLQRRIGAEEWAIVARGETDRDGRMRAVTTDTDVLERGLYRLVFHTRKYFERNSVPSFYPSITVEFEVVDASDHYHVPLLLSPFGYTTYRGS